MDIDLNSLMDDEKRIGDAMNGNIAPSELADMQRAMTERGYRPDVAPVAHERLARYLVRRNRGDRRGLVLLGECGLGKTMFLEMFCVRKVRTCGAIVKRFSEVGPGVEYDEWLHGGYSSGLCFAPPDDIALDELGWEPEANRYGMKQELLADVLGERYSLWKKHGCRTYITTNLTYDQMDTRYGRRITDRLREMCIAVRFEGDSARGYRPEPVVQDRVRELPPAATREEVEELKRRHGFA